MKENKICIKCGVPLVSGENITQYQIGHSQYICRDCGAKYARDRSHRIGLYQAMDKNRECALFLGVHVAERVLSHVFKNVIRMPHGNPGFDFKCGRDYMVDVKSSCRYHEPRRADRWHFGINNNKIAQYFLCLAFDNRTALIPEHVWLIPAGDVNDRASLSISETRLEKWHKYERPLDKVLACCNTLK